MHTSFKCITINIINILTLQFRSEMNALNLEMSSFEKDGAPMVVKNVHLTFLAFVSIFFI